MNNYDKEFLDVFNEYYPFERYIFKEPKSLGLTFDDAVLTEIFVPCTEIKPILNPDGSLASFTKINPNEVYVKIKGNAGEMRFAYIDFNDHIREQIRWNFVEDLGPYNYELLYVESEDENDTAELKELLKEQFRLINDKYGDCKIKNNRLINF
jgi:hypothetical protein